jgi:hypothetical protein
MWRKDAQMAKTGKTSFEKKCEILSDLWTDYRDDEDFKDFFEYNDLGVPMAYGLVAKLIEKLTPDGVRYIEDSFRLLLEGLETEDTCFDSLSDLLDRD